MVSSTSGQHKTFWYLQLNNADKDLYSTTQWNLIAQHEIGHVFGLQLENTGSRKRGIEWGC